MHPIFLFIPLLEGCPALASQGSWPFLAVLVSQWGIIVGSIRGKQCEADQMLHIETVYLKIPVNSKSSQRYIL